MDGTEAGIARFDAAGYSTGLKTPRVELLLNLDYGFLRAGFDFFHPLDYFPGEVE